MRITIACKANQKDNPIIFETGWDLWRWVTQSLDWTDLKEAAGICGRVSSSASPWSPSTWSPTSSASSARLGRRDLTSCSTKPASLRNTTSPSSSCRWCPSTRCCSTARTVWSSWAMVTSTGSSRPWQTREQVSENVVWIFKLYLWW